MSLRTSHILLRAVNWATVKAPNGTRVIIRDLGKLDKAELNTEHIVLTTGAAVAFMTSMTAYKRQERNCASLPPTSPNTGQVIIRAAGHARAISNLPCVIVFSANTDDKVSPMQLRIGCTRPQIKDG